MLKRKTLISVDYLLKFSVLWSERLNKKNNNKIET